RRSHSPYSSPKALALVCVSSKREEYCDEIANTMARTLSAQQANGRPLTPYRPPHMQDTAGPVARRIPPHHATAPHDCLPALTDLALRRLGDDTHPSVLTRDQAVQVLRQAIEDSPTFQQQSFHNVLHILMDEFGDDGSGLARQEFFDKFKDFAEKTLR